MRATIRATFIYSSQYEMLRHLGLNYVASNRQRFAYVWRFLPAIPDFKSDTTRF